MKKHIIAVSLLLFFSLSISGQVLKETSISNTIDGIKFKRATIDTLIKKEDQYYLYLELSIRGLFGAGYHTRIKTKSIKAKAEVVLDKNFNPQSKQLFFIQPKDVPGALQAVCVPNPGQTEGQAKKIAGEEKVIRIEQLTEKFPNYVAKQTKEKKSRAERFKALHAELPKSYYRNEVAYKGMILRKVSGYDMVRYTKKSLSDFEEIGLKSKFKDGYPNPVYYKKERMNAKWDNYRDMAKKDFWVSWGKDYSDAVNGNYFTIHSKKLRSDFHSIDQNYEFVSFDLNGKVINRTEQSYPAPQEISLFESFTEKKDGAYTLGSINCVLQDKELKIGDGIQKKFGSQLDINRKYFLEFDATGKLVWEKEIKLDDAYQMVDVWEAGEEKNVLGISREPFAVKVLSFDKTGNLTETKASEKATKGIQRISDSFGSYKTHLTTGKIELKGDQYVIFTKLERTNSTSYAKEYGDVYASIFNKDNELVHSVGIKRDRAFDIKERPKIAIASNFDDYVTLFYWDLIVYEGRKSVENRMYFIDKNTWTHKEAILDDITTYSFLKMEDAFMIIGVAPMDFKMLLMESE